MEADKGTRAIKDYMTGGIKKLAQTENLLELLIVMRRFLNANFRKTIIEEIGNTRNANEIIKTFKPRTNEYKMAILFKLLNIIRIKDYLDIIKKLKI